MNTHHHTKVNALTNPVSMGDCIIAESGSKYFVCQSMKGDYWLKDESGKNVTEPVSGQIGIVRQIDGLINC